MCISVVNATAAEPFKSLNSCISGQQNWSFCVCTCIDEVASMIEQLFDFITQIKKVTSECEST